MAETANDFPTILGPDATFKGELSFEKGLRLQGRLEGKINTPGRLHVSKEAKMQADVEAGSIVVEGDVKGNLTASDRVELKQSARYEGDLQASKLVVDEGAVFSGHVLVGPDAVKSGGGPTPSRPTGAPTPGGGAPRPAPTGGPQPAKQG
jgi:cytoskeletal protein CcmA (bactofilin family)